MAIIKPISDLRNKSNEISSLAQASNEPIFITKNGEGDLVVMSLSSYRKLQLKLSLFEKLAEAQGQTRSNVKPRLFSVALNEIRKNLHEKKRG